MARYYQLSVTASVPNKTTIKVGFGKLKGIFCSSASATPRITVYDSATQSASDPTIISLLTPQASENYPLSGSDNGVGLKPRPRAFGLGLGGPSRWTLLSAWYIPIAMPIKTPNMPPTITPHIASVMPSPPRSPDIAPPACPRAAAP